MTIDTARDTVGYPPLLARERGTLLRFLSKLDGADWGRPTPCPGWSMLDLASHLVGDDLSLLARHRDGHHGTPAPPGLDEAAFIAWLDDLQDGWVRAARRLSPRVVVDLLEWAGPQLAGAWAGQDPEERSASVSWAAAGPVPIWLDQARELSEYWIHRQQLRVALGLPADLGPPVAGAVLDALRWAYPYRLGALSRPVGDTVTIAVTGEVERRWHLRAGAAGWTFTDRPGTRTVGRLQVTADQAWRLLTNNLSPSEQGRLDVSGDGEVTGVLLRTRAIIGAPNVRS